MGKPHRLEAQHGEGREDARAGRGRRGRRRQPRARARGAAAVRARLDRAQRRVAPGRRRATSTRRASSRRSSSARASTACRSSRRARGRPPLHAALDLELRHRHGLLSARLVHDEVQPEVERGAARLPGFATLTRSRPPSSPKARSSSCTGSSGRSREIAGMDGVDAQPAAGAQGELRRAHDDPRLPPGARQPAQEGAHPRHGARHEPRVVRAQRLRGRAARERGRTGGCTRRP